MTCVVTVSEHHDRAEQGVVLVTVLWVLILLSLIATNLTFGGRSFARQTLNTEQSVTAELAAEAGISWAQWSLLQPAPSGTGQGYWLADGSTHDMEINRVQVRVALHDESGKLDINAVPTELLDALLEPVMEESSARAELVAAIEDWRDADDLVRLNGAEEDEYLAAGRPEGPGNRPFDEIRELAEVLGMTEPIYYYLQPHLTVVTRARTVNPQVASFEVLMSLPNASEGVVQRYIEERRSAWDNGLPVPELPFDASPYVDSRRAGQHYLVVTEARIAPYTHIRRGARILRRGNSTRLQQEQVLLPDRQTRDQSEDRY